MYTFKELSEKRLLKTIQLVKQLSLKNCLKNSKKKNLTVDNFYKHS